MRKCLLFIIFILCSIFFYVVSIKVDTIHKYLYEEEICYQNLSVSGVILARSGSKGIPHKNLAEIDGKSLLARAIHTMFHLKKFKEIWVSTDGENIANEAAKYGAKVHWRSKESATDTASSLFALKEFLSKHTEIENLALIQCTSPFLNVKYLEEAFKLLESGYNTIFSVTREHKLRWSDEKGIIKPINFNPKQRPRRQDWKGELIENGMFYFTSRKYINNGEIQGGKIGVVEIPKYYNIEIDSPIDLKISNILLNNYN